MDKQVNGWTMLTVILVFLLGYGFATLQTKVMIPAVSAQLGANQDLIKQVNEAFKNQKAELDGRFTKIEARLDAFEKK